jgi:hypothetical protein
VPLRAPQRALSIEPQSSGFTPAPIGGICRPDGIFAAPFEHGEIGPDLFRQACKFGLEGLVSKRRDRPYRAGRSPNWIKVKNRTHPAMSRVRDALSRP